VQVHEQERESRRRLSAEKATGMKEVLVFDVDGTLTPPRSAMDETMAHAMRRLIAASTIYLVTGSDRAKLEAQAPADILESVAGVFCCSGNEIWRGKRLVMEMRHVFPRELTKLAAGLLEASPYPVRTGRHIEERTGSLNISVVGRNASLSQRRDYQRHDRMAHERDRLIAAIEAQFPEYECNRGGQISIDIAPRGWNKARVFKEVRARAPNALVHFFGDTINEGGNDLPLAQALIADGPQHVINAVKDWRETLQIIERHYGADARKGRSSAVA
jgi:phosphomannomutase